MLLKLNNSLQNNLATFKIQSRSTLRLLESVMSVFDLKEKMLSKVFGYDVIVEGVNLDKGDAVG